MTYGLIGARVGHNPTSGLFPLRIGAGGQVTTWDISLDATTSVISTDTTGAYREDVATGKWTQLIRNPGFPDANLTYPLNGVYEIRHAPSDPLTLYMAYRPGGAGGIGYIYKSSDRGTTFVRTPTFSSTIFDCNSNNQKFFGPKLAIDPADKTIVYFADGDGTFHVSLDGSATWGTVPNVPTGTAGHPGSIVFDPASISSGKAQTIYIYSPGNGVYRSTNGGTSFAILGTGGPSTTPTILFASHMKLSTDGVLYLTQKSDANANARLWRWQSSAWTDLRPNINSGSANPETIVVDPQGTSGAGFLLAAMDGGFIWKSTDYGANWTSGGTRTQTAPNIGWFTVSGENFMTVGDMVMDQSQKVRFAEGIGAWQSSSSNYNAWTEQSVGIDNMVFNWIIAPPGGYPIVCCSDRPFFTITNPDFPATNYGPNFDHPIEYGSAADWATADPSFIVGLDVWLDESTSSSTDKGITWNRFSGNGGEFAAGRPNGSVAAASSSNIVYIPANRGNIRRTHDGGATWPEVPAANFGSVGMRNAATMNISAAAQGTGGGGTWIRLTVDSVGAALTGDGISCQGLGGQGTFGADISFHSFVVTVIDSTHIELQSSVWKAGYAGAASGIFITTYDTGWPWASFLRAHAVCSDRVTTGTFYAHNFNTAATGGGIYKSTDGGDNWTRQSTKFTQGLGLFCTNNTSLQSVPNFGSSGTGGHIFFSAGQDDSDALYVSTDGGANWSKAGTGTGAAGSNSAYGFGAVKPGNNYPSVYFVGYVNGVYGIWRSDNSKTDWTTPTAGVLTAITWTNLGTFPLGSVSPVSSIQGDPSIWGRGYLTTQTDGCYYFNP